VCRSNGLQLRGGKEFVEKNEISVANPSELTASIRDLIVHLHRGNNVPAEKCLNTVSGQLKSIMQSGMDPTSFPMQRAQQTMFAIDEVRTLMAQRDLNGALDAARDAGKEWSQKPKQEARGV
jgi:hypothetical protein